MILLKRKGILLEQTLQGINGVKQHKLNEQSMDYKALQFPPGFWIQIIRHNFTRNIIRNNQTW